MNTIEHILQPQMISLPMLSAFVLLAYAATQRMLSSLIPVLLQASSPAQASSLARTSASVSSSSIPSPKTRLQRSFS